MTEVIIHEDKLETVLDLLGQGVDDDGFVLDEDGERATSTDGAQIKSDDVGYLGHGSVEYVRDDFSSIYDYFESDEE